jgi:predicted MFS family arabinose efflux permease
MLIARCIRGDDHGRVTTTNISPRPALTRGLLLLMAVATGVSVGGNYLVQPLVVTIGRSFGIDGAVAGTIVTAAQLGYAAGLLLIVPLGQLLDKRRLVIGLLLVTAAGQALSGLSWSFPVMLTGTIVAGVFSVGAQVLVPFSAELAGEGRAGAAVGTVMSGLLIGTLIARTVAGLVATAFGWHAVFLCASGVMIVCTIALALRLPRSRPAARVGYGATLASVFGLLVRLPRLRVRAALGAVGFGAASAVFATMTLLLAGPGFRLNEAAIGAIGLFGVAGAFAAQISGRLTDRGKTVLVLCIAFGAAALGAVALWAGSFSLLAFMAGMLLLDFALQSVHVNNQANIYRLLPSARPLLTSAYMTSYFVGGSLGSTIALAIWPLWGWSGTVGLVAVLVVVGFVLGVLDRRLVRAAGKAGDTAGNDGGSDEDCPTATGPVAVR